MKLNSLLNLIAMVGCTFFTLGCASATDAGPAVDLRIVGGTVFDGSGAPGAQDYVVEVNGDQIVYVGPARSGVAQRTIDATGKIVAPGFIDPHTHAYGDLSDPQRSANLPYLFQGVSTVFVGNDGGVGRYDEVAANLAKVSVGTNVGVFSGHGVVRRQVLGNADRPPSADELRVMQNAVAQDMRGGAFGLSTGLFYAPGSFADLDEVVALAEVAAAYGGIYESHIRDESDYSIGLMGAIAEAIDVGREAGLPVHLAHLKALGPSVHGLSQEIIAMVEGAHDEGIEVSADQYPWLASGTRLSNALIPRRVMTGGSEVLANNLADAAFVAEISAEMIENLRRRGGAEALLITGQSEHQGMTLAQVAEELNAQPILAAVDIVRAGDPAVASFMMQEQDVERLMVQDWVVTSSDGSRGHPRKYGSFPEKYATYVKDKGLLDLATFIHRSTGATAQLLNLCNRGFLRSGYQADIVVFDPATFQANATYERPEELAQGVEYLLVNGVAAIDAGEMSNGTAGRLLNLQACTGR